MIKSICAVSLLCTLSHPLLQPSPYSFSASDAPRHSTSARQSLTIRGTVTDAASGQPIEAVSVGSNAPGTRSVVTDKSGFYELVVDNLRRGQNVAITFRRIGYENTQVTQTATQDTVQVSVTMRMATLSLQTVVTSASTAATRSYNGLSGRVAGRPIREQKSSSVASAAAPPLTPAPNATVISAREGSEFNREQYDRIDDNPFLAARSNALSTFSIDVDRASYANVRSLLTEGQRPPKDAVRIEELVNYFPYTLPQPKGKEPLTVTTEVGAAPWRPENHLVRIALQSRSIDTDKLPTNNLVFLIDVSGSMEDENKLPLVKQSLRLLVDQMREQDRVSLVVYAGAAGLVLPSTSGAKKATIMQAIDRLEAGGSTAGGEGLTLAYRVARENFIREGNNRVILATDGDFNVGVSSDAAMERLIESKRSEGTYLTVLGFGRGNIQDAKMEKMAKQGNGNYAYIDDIMEARKMFVQEMGGTLVTVANDVKVQVEFNPSVVRAYRLIGYENRALRDEDFSNDRKDAGDVGSGHSVTALYEILPVGVKSALTVRGLDALRYVENRAEFSGSEGEMMFVKIRYKNPGDSVSQLIAQPVRNIRSSAVSDDFRFAAAVASFGMLLRDSEYKGNASTASVREMARAARGRDAGGYRAGFLELVERWNRTNAASDERR
ncbi:MAG: YfbK domain-containing protein [Gemmatimonas sp.]